MNVRGWKASSLCKVCLFWLLQSQTHPEWLHLSKSKIHPSRLGAHTLWIKCQVGWHVINPSMLGVEKPNKCHCSCCLSNLVSHSVEVEAVLLAARETCIFIMCSFSLGRTVKTNLPSAHHTPWTDWSYLWVQAAGCYTPSQWPGGSWWYTTQPR